MPDLDLPSLVLLFHLKGCVVLLVKNLEASLKGAELAGIRGWQDERRATRSIKGHLSLLGYCFGVFPPVIL